MKLQSSNYYTYELFGELNKRLEASFKNALGDELNVEKNLLDGEIQITISSVVNFEDIEEAVSILERLEKEFYND